jgi:hypothetical protein
MSENSFMKKVKDRSPSQKIKTLLASLLWFERLLCPRMRREELVYLSALCGLKSIPRNPYKVLPHLSDHPRDYCRDIRFASIRISTILDSTFKGVTAVNRRTCFSVRNW